MTLHSAYIGAADHVFRAREIRRLEPQSRWDKETINSVIGVLCAVDIGQVDSRQTRSSSGPNSTLAIAIGRSTNPEGTTHKARHGLIWRHCGLSRLQSDQGQETSAS